MPRAGCPASTPTISCRHSNLPPQWPTNRFIHGSLSVLFPPPVPTQLKHPFLQGPELGLRWWPSLYMLSQHTIIERLLTLLSTLCFSHWTVNYVRAGISFLGYIWWCLILKRCLIDVCRITVPWSNSQRFSVKHELLCTGSMTRKRWLGKKKHSIFS